MRFIIVNLLLLFFTSVIGFSQIPTLNHNAFTDGEEITYKVYYNWKFVWVPTGEVTFFTTETDSAYEVRVVGMSYPSYDSVFKVSDNYITRIDKSTLKPIYFRRDIEEGSYIRYDSLKFDHDDLSVEEYFGRTKDVAKYFKFDTKENVLDMLSAIYLMRGIDFGKKAEETSIPFRIFFDKELLELDIHFRGLETSKLKSVGKVSTWHMQADLIGGNIFDDGDVMDIWVSDDGNNIPMQIVSPIKFGSIKAVLKSVKGSKFNFDFDITD